MTDLASRMKELRKNQGLTQEALAEKLGLQKSAIAKYENGRVSNIKRSTLETMSKIFGVTPSYILGYEEDKVTSITSRKSTQSDKPYEDIFPFLNKNGYQLSYTIHQTIELKNRINKTYFTLSLQEFDELYKKIGSYASFCIQEAETKHVEEPYLQLEAAHAIKNAAQEDIEHDNDIMDDENF